jgi:hypothetical protein
LSPPAITVTVFFDTLTTGGSSFQLNDSTKGKLDDATYVLGGDTGTDVTSYVTSVSIDRGRLSPIFDDIDAGRCTILLNNETRRFDPLYASGPYYGNLKPGKRVRVQAGGMIIFDGRISDWDLSYDVSGRSVATMIVEDALATLGRLSFDAWTATASQTTGQRLTSILNRTEVGWPAGQRDLDTGKSTLQGDNVSWGSNVLNYCQLVSKSDGPAAFFASRSNVLTFRDRHAALVSAPVVTFGTSNNTYLSLPGTAGAFATVPDSAALDLTGSLEIVARVAATDWTNGTSQRIFSKLNGASVATGGGYELYVSASGTLHFQYSNGTNNFDIAESAFTPADNTTYWVRATFNSGTSTATLYYASDQSTEPTSWITAGSGTGTGSPSANAVTAHIGGMSGLSRELTGRVYRVIVRDAVSGGTTVLDADFTRGITSSATSSFVEYSANAATVTIAGGTPVYSVTTVPFQEVGISTGSDTFYTRATVTRAGGTAQSYTAAAASSDGIVTLTIDGVLMSTDAQALDMATFYASVFSGGEARISQVGVVLDSAILPAAQLQALLNVEINDVVGINWTPNGVGNALEQRAVVLGIQHDYVPGVHRLRLTLGRYDTRVPLILNSTTNGVLNGAPVLAY